MLTDLHREYLKTIARTTQIIVLGLTAGVVTFGVIAVVVGDRAPQNAQPAPAFIAYLAIAVACVALVASLVVPALVATNARRRIVAGLPAMPNPRVSLPPELGDVGPLGAVYQTRLIIGAAILEGAAFFNLVVYIVGGYVPNLVAAAVMLAAILSLFPTRSRVEDWIENQLRVIEQLRQMQPHDAR